MIIVIKRMAFVERDVSYLLYKVPGKYEKRHYHSGEVRVRELF